MNATLRQLLEDVEAGKIGPQLQARAKLYLNRYDPARRRALEKELPASVQHADARRAAADAAEEQAIREMHDAVWTWNLTQPNQLLRGRCDCGCGFSFRHRGEGELDHWIEKSQGGPNTRENGWRLLDICHRRKTDRKPPFGPGPSTWNERHAIYCARAGIIHKQRKERR